MLDHVLTASVLLVAWLDPGVATYPNQRLLVEPAELLAAKAESLPVILDARSQQRFAVGHIVGARWVDAGDWAKTFGNGDDTADWSEKIGDLGIDGRTPIVVYDDNLNRDAARVWWILRYWGVPDVRLLNGGWTSWGKQDGADKNTTASAIVNHVPVTFEATPIATRLATKDQLLALLRGNGAQVIDARSEREFCGIDALTNRRGGAIPGAKHLEWSDLLDKESGRFKSADELRQSFRDAGIDPLQPSVTHCQSGGRASVIAFGIELLGGETANYYKGWSEWGNADDTPIEQHETKNTKAD